MMFSEAPMERIDVFRAPEHCRLGATLRSVPVMPSLRSRDPWHSGAVHAAELSRQPTCPLRSSGVDVRHVFGADDSLAERLQRKTCHFDRLDSEWNPDDRDAQQGSREDICDRH
jgi:hypothetical protein